MDAPLPIILEETLNLIKEVKEKEERYLEEDLLNKLKTGMSVIGLEETLTALGRSQVHTLIIAKDYDAPGVICPLCGRFYLSEEKLCPIDKIDLELIDEMLNEAIDLAIEKDSQTKFISNDILKEKGGLAAVLRYPLVKTA